MDLYRLLFFFHSWIGFANYNKVSKLYLHMAEDAVLYVCVVCSLAVVCPFGCDSLLVIRVYSKPGIKRVLDTRPRRDNFGEHFVVVRRRPKSSRFSAVAQRGDFQCFGLSSHSIKLKVHLLGIIQASPKF